MLNKGKQDSATECLKELHRLPVKLRCTYKTLTIMYSFLNKKGPTFLPRELNIKNSQRSSQGDCMESGNKQRNTVFTPASHSILTQETAGEQTIPHQTTFILKHIEIPSIQSKYVSK